MRIVVADLTNANAGTERDLLARLIETFEADKENTYIVCKPYQAPHFSAYAGRVRILPAMAHHSRIADFVQREFIDELLLKGDPADTLTLISFHPAVLGIRDFLSTSTKPRIDAIHWTRLHKPASPARPAVDFAGAALTALLSEDEIMSAVRRALTAANATDAESAVRMSDVRLYLEREEPRLRKTNPQANVPGIISAAINFAARRGSAVVDRNVHPVNPPVWLATQEATGTPISKPQVETERVLQPEILAKAIATDEPTSSAAAMSGPETARAAVPTQRSRSDVFVDTLRNQGLGPFSRVRVLLYDSVERIMQNGNATKKDIVTILGSAVERVEESYKPEPGEKPISWRKVRPFLRTLTARRAIFVTEQGQTIASGFGTLSIPIKELVQNWRQELDGELVLALVQSGLKLHLADLPHLAGALFNDRTDDTEAKVGAVIEFLIKANRLRDSKEHHLVETATDTTPTVVAMPSATAAA